MPLDLSRLRADTPACEERLHFNNAGAALMAQPVYQRMIDHLALEQRIGGYEAEAAAAPAIASLYTGFARLLRVEADEIAYVENATRAWDLAFYSLPLVEGDRILTHQSEYGSNYMAMLQQAQRRGLIIDHAPSDSSGQVDIEALPGHVRPRTRVLAVTHAPSQSGLINPVAAIGRIANDHGLIYLLDACQSAGQIDVDVKSIGCHLLSGTGRKFLRGPRGSGFLYVARQLLEHLDPPFVDMRAAEWISATQFQWAPGARRFEVWESNVAARIGLAGAVDYALAIGLPAIEARVCELGGALRQALADLPGVTVHDRGEQHSGIVTFSKQDEPAEALMQRLGKRGMNVSVSYASTAQLDLKPRGLATIVRASPHYYNTLEEVERLVAAVASTD